MVVKGILGAFPSRGKWFSHAIVLSRMLQVCVFFDGASLLMCQQGRREILSFTYVFLLLSIRPSRVFCAQSGKRPGAQGLRVEIVHGCVPPVNATLKGSGNSWSRV